MIVAWILFFLLVILIIFPYALYPIVLKLMPGEKKYSGEKQKPESVTLFIAAYNEEKVIAEKLENSLKIKTEGIPFEIVVGSDGSTDRTNEIVKSYAEKFPEIRLENFTDRQGKVNVINRGIPLCKGEIILLSDANAMYNADCLQKILPHFENPHVGCVAGEKRIADESGMIGKNEGIYWKLESFIKKQESRVKTVIGADGACYAIRKELFETLPKDTSVDDFLLSMKIVEKGYKIEYEPGAYSSEETGQNMQQELKRKVRIAAGNFHNLTILKHFFKPSQESFMFISHKFLRWISPFLFFAMTLLLAWMSINSIVAGIFFVLLCITYLITFIKYLGIRNFITDNKLSKIFSYFYITVWAQWLGYLKYRKKSQGAVWDTIRQG